jgi:flagellar M-ring protein FliF
MSDPGNDKPSQLPQALEGAKAALDKARASVAALPKPAKILFATTLVSVLAIGAYFGVAPMFEEYRPIWTELDPADAAAMVDVLEERGVPYRLEADGTTIAVPADQADATRLSLASAGKLPTGGKFGLDELAETPIGTSEAMQKVLRKRAIEGELGRTIESIGHVKSARVHLVLHERSLFVKRVTPSRASITVQLKGSATLDAEQIASIVHLTASAVPHLDPGQVSLVTTEGSILHRPVGENDDGLSNGLGQDLLSRKAKYERDLEHRVLTLVESFVGPGHARVRVHADIDTAKVERKTDEYGPSPVIETHRLTTEGGTIARGVGATNGGVPGAESNLPAGDDVPPEGGAAPAEVPTTNSGRTDESKFYKVPHIQERRVQVEQTVKRTTVAVAIDEIERVVDGQTLREPLPEEQMTAIRALVADAVGFDEARGDSLDVTSLPFHRPEIAEIEEPVPLLPIPDKYQKWVPLASRVGLGLLALIAFLILRRKWRKHVAAQQAAEEEEVHDGELMAGEAATKAALEGGETPEELRSAANEEVAKILNEAQQIEDAKVSREAKLEMLRGLAVKRATNDAATAALVLRHWLGTAQSDEREEAA